MLIRCQLARHAATAVVLISSDFCQASLSLRLAQLWPPFEPIRRNECAYWPVLILGRLRRQTSAHTHRPRARAKPKPRPHTKGPCTGGRKTVAPADLLGRPSEPNGPCERGRPLARLLICAAHFLWLTQWDPFTSAATHAGQFISRTRFQGGPPAGRGVGGGSIRCGADEAAKMEPRGGQEMGPLSLWSVGLRARPQRARRTVSAVARLWRRTTALFCGSTAAPRC